MIPIIRSFALTKHAKNCTVRPGPVCLPNQDSLPGRIMNTRKAAAPVCAFGMNRSWEHGASVFASSIAAWILPTVWRIWREVYPNAKKIVLVCDNLSTHKPHFLYERFAPEEAHRLKERFEWHFTPEHGSWLNIAECELSVLSRQCLSRRIEDIATLRCEVAAWERERNRCPHTVSWQFTSADARTKLKRLYPEVKNKTLLT